MISQSKKTNPILSAVGGFQMNVNLYVIKEYKNEPRLPARTKQTQSNPTCSELVEPISKAKKCQIQAAAGVGGQTTEDGRQTTDDRGQSFQSVRF